MISCVKRVSPTVDTSTQTTGSTGVQEYRQPYHQSIGEENQTPENHASMELVKVGKDYLNTHQYAKASNCFRDAINIDNQNGIAYYHLALVYLYEGHIYLVEGVLDQAAFLLAHDDEWHERIEELRSEIEVEKQERRQDV